MAKLRNIHDQEPTHAHKMEIMELAVKMLAGPEWWEVEPAKIQDRIKATVDQLVASYNDL
jgi:hypothetical protein